MSHTLFILFWATGDLAKRYLLPSLANICKNGSEMDIIAVGRRPFTSEDFRNFIREEGWWFFSDGIEIESFLSKVIYSQVEIDEAKDYHALAETIKSKSKNTTQIVIYLSIATEHFPFFLEHIAPYKVSLPPIRVVFEKPFGSDLASARTLQKQIEAVFPERDVYRIDHYVAKNGIENLLAFRFWNTVFDPVWNHKFIDNIQITASESLGIGDRGGFYEKAWALRDMVQNHLFQTLAMVIMRKPKSLKPHDLQEAKTEALGSLLLSNRLEEAVVFGQYEWYRNEKNVDIHSQTETFVALEVASKFPEWAGVPFYIRTGKKLDIKVTQIVIEFKLPENIGFSSLEQNRIVIEIQPDESIEITFAKKSQSDDYALEPMISSSRVASTGKWAYEKLLEDVIIWDPTLFTTWEMLELTWKAIDPIIHCKEACPIVHIYPPWSRWPKAMYELLENSGRKWYEWAL